MLRSDAVGPSCGCLEKDFFCARDDPLGDIHTPRIFEACDGGSLSMCSSPSYVFRESWELSFSICHFPVGYQFKSKRYHFFMYSDLSSSCSCFSCKDIEAVLREFDHVLGGGVGRGVDLNYCGIINKAISYNLCCIS